MKVPDLVVNGSPLRLGKRIGRGGEGDVYLLADFSDRALKFYTASDIAEREPKVQAMVDRRIASNSQLVAFPLEVARRRDGKFAGFLMKLVSGHKPLFELYAPGARKKHFPRADYRFLVRAAANISRAVASVHKSGCVIGDINCSGILVSDSAVAALIDADSFQFVDGSRQYLCRVGVPDYTPPELQGRKLSDIPRTINHDAFGLAVVIFQVLSMGKHPFIGSYSGGEMPMERAIREYRFVYSRKRQSGMTPPPGAIKLTDFPPEIAEAFELAFGNNNVTRPSAERWIHLLEELERSIVKCKLIGLHYYPSSAGDCPWCRLEGQTGAILFLPDLSLMQKSGVSSSGADLFNLEQLWQSIESISIPDISKKVPPFQSFECEPSGEAQRFRRGQTTQRFIGVLAVACAILLFLAAPTFLIISVWIGFYGLSKLLTNTQDTSNLIRKHKQCHDTWVSAITDWHSRCGISEVLSLKGSLTDARNKLELLPQEQARRISDYQRNRQSNHLRHFLDRYLICDSKIKGIGPARQAALATFGVETAADVTMENVLRVPGFGPTNSLPLFEWRRKIESKFVYNDKPTSDDQREIQLIQTSIQQSAEQLKTTLLAGSSNLKIAIDRMQARLKSNDPTLAKLDLERQQLEADLKYLGCGVPLLNFDASASQYQIKSQIAHSRAVPTPSIAIKLSVQDVYRFFGTKYANRGDAYQRTGRVTSISFDQGTAKITGIVRGRDSRAPYHVAVELDQGCRQIKRASCSCPMGGICKHSAALLLEALKRRLI